MRKGERDVYVRVCFICMEVNRVRGGGGHYTSNQQIHILVKYEYIQRHTHTHTPIATSLLCKSTPKQFHTQN